MQSLAPYRVSLGALVALPRPASTAAAHEPRDIIVHGGSSAAVIAALRGQVGGHRLARQTPLRPLERGLGWTDTGNKAVIGGLARDFYHRV